MAFGSIATTDIAGVSFLFGVSSEDRAAVVGFPF